MGTADRSNLPWTLLAGWVRVLQLETFYISEILQYLYICHIEMQLHEITMSNSETNVIHDGRSLVPPTLVDTLTQDHQEQGAVRCSQVYASALAPFVSDNAASVCQEIAPPVSPSTRVVYIILVRGNHVIAVEMA